jgi:hypothetical protein
LATRLKMARLVRVRQGHLATSLLHCRRHQHRLGWADKRGCVRMRGCETSMVALTCLRHGQCPLRYPKCTLLASLSSSGHGQTAAAGLDPDARGPHCHSRRLLGQPGPCRAAGHRALPMPAVGRAPGPRLRGLPCASARCHARSLSVLFLGLVRGHKTEGAC